MRFPDIEALARTYLLTGTYDGAAKVHIKVPSTRPVSFLRVWRTGGAAVNRVLDAPLITVESWSDSGSKTADGKSGSDKIAVDNANTARQLLLNASGVMPLVRGVEEVTGLYFDPDPVSGVTRYTFTVRLRVRATRA